MMRIGAFGIFVAVMGAVFGVSSEFRIQNSECLAAEGAAATSGASASLPATMGGVDSVAIEPQRKVSGVRAFGPKMVYREEAEFRVECGENLTDFLDGHGEGSEWVVEVVQGEKILSGAVKMERKPTKEAEAKAREQAATRPNARKVEKGLYSGSLKLDVAGLSEGEATWKLRVKLKEGAEKELPKGVEMGVAVEKFEVVRKAYGKVAEGYREELGLWLDDHNAQRAIWGKVPLWGNLERALGQAEDPYRGLRGMMLRSYVNPDLGRRQGYTLYVPRGLEMKGKVPLLILLHGSGGDYRNLIADAHAGQNLEEYPMLIANAGAFQHQEFRHMAMGDVMGVLADVKKKYAVDEERVYVQGISLGGRGAMEVAALVPDVFAGVSGQGTYGIMSGLMDPVAVARKERVSLELAARGDMRTWLPNLRNVPTEILWGWKDDTTPPGLGLVMAEMLEGYGGKVRGRGFDTTHNISVPEYRWETTRKWMLEQKREAEPKRIVHRVSNLRYGKSGWVTVEGLVDYAKVGEVRAEYDAGKKVLGLGLANVGAVRIVMPEDVEGVVGASGQMAAVKWKKGDVVTLSADGKVRLGEAGDGALKVDGRKRAGVSGPLWDVFCGPVVYVYPGVREGEKLGAEEVAMRERLKKAAEASAEWDVAWGEKKLMVVSDGELTEEMKKSRSVILFCGAGELGTRSTELVKAAVGEAELFPKGVEGNVKVAVRPSPWAKERYVMVVEVGTDGAFGLHDLGWWDAGLQTDWVVVDVAGERAGRGRRRSGEMKFVAAGVYDGGWKLGAFTREDYRGEAMLGAGSRGN